MVGNLTAEAFVNIVLQSQLIDPASIQELLDTFKKEGVKVDDAVEIGKAFVKAGKLTSWQVEKLLQGKHKGFILGKYHLRSLLGKGGMSSVYLAEHRLMQRRCAIKVLPAKRVHDSSYLGRFHREAQAVASMDHPNIVRAYDVDHVKEGSTEIHFLVMEYIEGSDLQELVLESGPIDFALAADYIRQASDGLTHAHKIGMVHRDIKPANLLLDKSNTVKILDMGLARFFEDTDEKSLTVTHNEKVLGTADYLSPEQALDSHNVDSRADIYSLGCTIYFLLTGQPPFNTGTLAQRLMAHQTQEPTSIKNYRSNVPESLLKIIDKMMVKKPEDRYQTAEEVSNVLVGWLLENGGDDWKKKHPNLQVKDVADLEPSNPVIPTSDSRLDISSGFDIDVPLKPLDEEGKEKKNLKESSSRRRRSRSGIRRASESSRIENQQKGESSIVSKAGKKETSPNVKKGMSPKGSSGSSRIIKAATPLTDLESNEDIPNVSNDSEMDIVVAEVVDDNDIHEEDYIIEADSDPSMDTQSVASSILLKKVAENDGKFDLILFLTQNRLAQGALGVIFLFLVVSVGTLLYKNNFNNGLNGPIQKTSEGVNKLSVGQDSSFPFDKITMAINFFKNEIKKNKAYKAVIEVSPGQYEEFIHLSDINDGELKITCNKGTARLFPHGDKPIISLDNCQNVIVEGFSVKAQDKAVAIKLSGKLDGCELRNLNVSEFSLTGIECAQVRGKSRTEKIIIEGIKFSNSKPNSTGIAISGKVSDTSFLSIQNSRFLSPLKTGIQIDDNFVNSTINNCRFSELQNGIVFSTPRPKLNLVLIHNNTFHKMSGNSIVFNTMPDSNSGQSGIYNNLFSNGESGDVVIDQKNWKNDTFAGYFQSRKLVHNYTTRNKDEFLSGEILIYSNGKNQKSVIEFSSTDPSSDTFLNLKSLKNPNGTVNSLLYKVGAK